MHAPDQVAPWLTDQEQTHAQETNLPGNNPGFVSSKLIDTQTQAINFSDNNILSEPTVSRHVTYCTYLWAWWKRCKLSEDSRSNVASTALPDLKRVAVSPSCRVNETFKRNWTQTNTMSYYPQKRRTYISQQVRSGAAVTKWRKNFKNKKLSMVFAIQIIVSVVPWHSSHVEVQSCARSLFQQVELRKGHTVGN